MNKRRIKVFRALQTFVSDDPTRGALCHVYVAVGVCMPMRIPPGKMQS